ncbi:MAG: GNAT family N-acetyltransferase [Rufibacter sp.]
MNLAQDRVQTTAFPELQTNRFILRRFQQSDLEHVYLGLSHPEVIKYYGVHYTTLQDTQKQLDWFWENEQNQTGFWWAITSLNRQIFYGACGLNHRVAEHRKAEIGYWLLPEHWGQGIIPEVVPLVCHFGFTALNLHRIEAWVETENLASKSVATRLGFVHEGTLRDCEIKNGRFISLDIYAKLADSK